MSLHANGRARTPQGLRLAAQVSTQRAFSTFCLVKRAEYRVFTVSRVHDFLYLIVGGARVREEIAFPMIQQLRSYCGTAEEVD